MKKNLHIKDIIIVVLACALALVAVQYFTLSSKEPGENNLEVERKFLLNLNDLPADMATRGDVFELVQTYISYSPEMRVRKINDIYYYFTMKLPRDTIGLAREEIEFIVTKDEYNDLLAKQVGDTIYKTRYQFYEQGTLIAVDVYSGGLTGLAVVEAEFENVGQAEKYTPPEWFGKDITSDLRYKNANLARHGMPVD